MGAAFGSCLLCLLHSCTCPSLTFIITCIITSVCGVSVALIKRNIHYYLLTVNYDFVHLLLKTEDALQM
jgi:hypothetical protein